MDSRSMISCLWIISMFRLTLECLNQLENIDMLLRNYYRKVGEDWEEMVSLALWEERGTRVWNSKNGLGCLGWRCTPEPNIQSSDRGGTPVPYPGALRLLSYVFISTPPILKQFKINYTINMSTQNHTQNMKQTPENFNNRNPQKFKRISPRTHDFLTNQLYFVELNHDWCMGELTQWYVISHT